MHLHVYNKYLLKLLTLLVKMKNNYIAFWMLHVLVPGLVPRSISKLDWAGNETTLALVLLLDEEEEDCALLQAEFCSIVFKHL